jgi:predicted MPP superfamily phosphohydrolase
MRTLRFRIIYLLIFALAIALAAYRLPAYSSRLPWLLLVAISDLFLFYWFSKTGLIQNSVIRKTLLTLTALPSIFLLSFLLSTAFITPVAWNPTLRTYLIGLAVMLYLVRAFPLPVLIYLSLKVFSACRKNLVPAQKKTGNSGIKISLGFSAIALAVMITGMIWWTYSFEVVEQQIPVKSLPESFQGYRIVQISDLHLGRWHSAKPLEKAFEIVNAQQADMIIFTGDLVNYSTSEALPFRQILSGLKARDGVYAVLGNHDYGDYLRWPDAEKKQTNINSMFEFLAEAGWIVLENKHVNIFRGNHCMSLAGVGNYSTKNHYPNRADLKQALAGIPDSCSLILLSHIPGITNVLHETNHHVNLILSGHTHALQLGLNFRGRKYSPAALIYDFWGGLYEFTSGDYTGRLYVNRGLGHIFIPMRIGAKPEITVLTLFEEK